jgi:hypothetical protein
VVAELKKAGLEAEPGHDLNAFAFDGPNRVDLALEDAFDEYEADPEREDEIVPASSRRPSAAWKRA